MSNDTNTYFMHYGKTAVQKEILFMGVFTTLCCVAFMAVSSLVLNDTFRYVGYALLCAGIAGGHTVSKSKAFRAETRGKLWMATGIILGMIFGAFQYVSS